MKRKGIIYKAEDTIVHKVYIGQTYNTLEKRKEEHLLHALENIDRSYFSVFYKMIRFFGPDKFIWEVLEDQISENELNNKEIYYIEKYDSYRNGYNSHIGGQHRHISILNDQEVKEITKLLKETDLSLVEISKKFPKCTKEMVSDINRGDTWYRSNLSYPIRDQGWNKQINFSDKQIKEIIYLLQSTDLQYKKIAEKFNCHPITIKKISDGKLIV